MVRTCSFVLALLVIGCGPEAAPPQASVPAPVAAAPAAAAVVAVKATATPAPAAPVVDTGPLGVAACDEYIAAYRTCIEGLSAEARASHSAVVDGQRAAWGKAKADAKTVAALPDACTAARAAAKVGLPDCTGW